MALTERNIMRRLEFNILKAEAVRQATNMKPFNAEEASELQQDIFEAIISSQAQAFGLSREEVLDGLIVASRNRGYFTQFRAGFSLLPEIGSEG
jgi:hypothetical protein